MGKGTKSITFYILMLLIFGSLMYFIVKEGESIQVHTTVQTLNTTPQNMGEGFLLFWDSVTHHIHSPIGILLLQIIAILIVCRIFGWLFLKIGQPTVIGEIVAGIVLGPSVLGNLLPDVSAFLFPPESLWNITILSQFGLILFMFAIGMELDISEVRKKLKETILISHTSTIVPFFCGMLTAYFVYESYANKETPFISFALFIGIAMSITAFPVLARIIQEKGLTKTHLGTISLASAANGDITAWCLLAVVIAIAQAGSMLSAIYNIVFSFIYISFMFFAVRPFLRMVGHIYHNKEVIDKGLVAFMFLLLIISSYFTEMLGLHALFGAFIAGVVMPSNVKFRKIMIEKVEDVSLALFLPLFFVSTGLRTEIGLLNTPELWSMCGIFIVVAIIGKFGGAMFSARFVGESWKDSLYIGALMNTRGLMELVVLTIGYDMGILPPAIFVMLVLMTLVTTFMTTPLVSLINLGFNTHDKIKKQRSTRESLDGTFKVLLSFGRAGNGQIMLDVAHQMFSRGNKKLDLTALHLTVGADINPLHTDNFKAISFEPILYGAKKLGFQIQTRYEISNNAGEDICNIVNNEGYDFLLVGSGISYSNSPEDIEANRYRTSFYNRFFRRFKAPESWFYPGDLLKDKTKTFIARSHCDVGVFINRNFIKATSIIVIFSNEEELFLLDYVKTLLKSTHGSVSILNRAATTVAGYTHITNTIKEFISSIPRASLLPNKDLTAELFYGFNFMLIGYNTWNDVSEHHKEALQKMPSTLILNKYQKSSNPSTEEIK
jgi:Kef-type K+ transport system membrane component KefB